MGKPLKTKALNSSGSVKSSVLARQGVKINKRIRLGHTGHFGKITEVPLDVKPKKPKSKFNKFKKDTSGEVDQSETHDQKREKEDAESVSSSRPHGGNGANPDAEKNDRVERLPGESFCKFMKRLNRETTEKLIEQSSKARKVGCPLLLCPSRNFTHPQQCGPMLMIFHGFHISHE
jgi:hypothetical protein